MTDRNLTIVFLNKLDERVQARIVEGLEDIPLTLLVAGEGETDSPLTLAPQADIMVGWRSDLAVSYSRLKRSAAIASRATCG